MGNYVKGEKIYVQAKIAEVMADDSTRYRVQTQLANFYVTERGDVLRGNPADVYTASEFYAMIQTIGKMSAEDIHICFGDEVNTLADVISHGWSISELREMFKEWQYSNDITVGDMVYYTSDNIITEDPTVICSVIGVEVGSDPETATDNTYTIFDDQNNIMYMATRSELASAHTSSSLIIQALRDLKDATEKAREDIG